MDESSPLIETKGGDTVLDMTEVREDRGPTERVEHQKSMSPSAAVLGAIVGDEEARTYLEQKIARVNLVVESIFFVGAVVVIIVGATRTVDLDSIAWAGSVITVYTAGAGGYYARQTDKLVGFAYQVDRLRGQVTRLSEEVDRLAPQVDRLAGENDRYTALLEQHASMQAEMESVLTGLTSKHAELAEDADEIDAAVEGLARLKAQFDKVLPKLDSLVDGLRGQVAELTGQVDELTGQVDELEGQVRELDGQIEELTAQIDGLERARLGLEKSVAMLSELQGAADKQGAFDAKVNEESKRIVAEQKALQERRAKLQKQQEELLEREAHLVKELEKQAAKLSKLDRLEVLVAQSARRKLELSRKLAQVTGERDAAKTLARIQAREAREAREAGDAAFLTVHHVTPVEEEGEEDGVARRVSGAGKAVLGLPTDEEEEEGGPPHSSVV